MKLRVVEFHQKLFMRSPIFKKDGVCEEPSGNSSSTSLETVEEVDLTDLPVRVRRRIAYIIHIHREDHTVAPQKSGKVRVL